MQVFWQTIGNALITALCHIASNDPDVPDDFDKIAAIPLPEQAEAWLDAAPPMSGGEFLNREMLALLWEKLLAWCIDELRQKGGLALFLKERAPQWQHVGRIFFHLAENKLDQSHPFAFLATYTVGLNAQGQPKHVPLSHALTRYVRAKDRPALVRLLDPLSKSSEQLPWVKKMIENKSIYQACPWGPRQAYTVLKSADTLEECGVGMRLPNWWKKRSRPRVQATLNTQQNTKLGVNALLDISLSIVIGDEEYSRDELESLLKSWEDGLVFFNGQWIEVDREKLEQALYFWKEVEERALHGELTFAQGLRLLAGVPEPGRETAEEEVIHAWSFAEAGRGFSDLLAAARLETTELEIPGLRATLRPYQIKGVQWLSFLGKLGLGACLADDMGLGKTLQILSLLLKERDGSANLLIAPASLLSNWQAEARRFAPDLRLFSLHGKNKTELDALATQTSFQGYDLVLVSYSGCARLPWLGKYPWKRVICDEAQAIKNPGTNQSKAVRALTPGAHIALTGTPVENSLTDLWALLDFLNPGLLGSAKSFHQLTKSLSESEERFAPLRRLTAPYILRRMKTDKSVIDSLPDKTEMPLYCQLTEAQAKLYVSVTEKLKESLQECREQGGEDKKRRMIVLQTLMLLKQICNHPLQATMKSGEYLARDSGKFLAVGELCESIAARQEKVLIFTQFREIIAPLEQYLAKIFRCEGLVLHGGISVKKRQPVVDAFQTPDGPPFLILTLKVGGTGLTLTEANHVIHFDRWWNPAVEDQATDRAYRIGQKKNVLVHKCLTVGTLEEKIDDLISEKRQLADEILGDTASEINLTRLTDEEICDLVRFDASQLSA